MENQSEEAKDDTYAEYRPIETEFFRKHWHHKQVFREGDIAIYKRWRVESNPHYEVIRVQRQQAREFKGVHYEAAERYPTEGQWGEQGWTYMTIEDALAKSHLLLNPEVTKRVRRAASLAS